MNKLKFLIPVLCLGLLILIGAGCREKGTSPVAEPSEQEEKSTGVETDDTFKGLSSLRFKQEFGEGTYKVITTYTLRNLDRNSPDIRTERYMPNSAETRTITIVLGEEQKGWIYTETSFGGGEWETFADSADITFEDEIEELSHVEYVIGQTIKNGEKIKEEHRPGPNLRVYDIELNPEIDSSLFGPGK